jgi:hypothetical protein
MTSSDTAAFGHCSGKRGQGDPHDPWGLAMRSRRLMTPSVPKAKAAITAGIATSA